MSDAARVPGEGDMTHGAADSLSDQALMAPARPLCGDVSLRKVPEPVLQRLADYVFLPPSKADPQQQTHAMDVLLRAVGQCSSQARSRLSMRLSHSQPRSRDLAALLSRDRDISVAAPVLLNAALLSDRDLVAIAQEGDGARCELIAGRREISTAVSAALVASGDISIIRRVLENRGARLSSETMSVLLELAARARQLHRPLLSRPEITARYALSLFWHLAPPLRQNVLSRFLGDCNILRRLLDPDDGAARKSADPGPGDGEENQRILRLLIKNIEEGKIALAAKKLGGLVTIPAKLSRKLIEDASGEPIAVAMKAAGVTSRQFGECISRWTRSSKAPLAPDRDIDGLAGVFERLSRDQARMAITYWQWQLQDNCNRP